MGAEPFAQEAAKTTKQTTGNRFGATVLPPIAGFAIDLAGGNIGAGFYATSAMFALGGLGMAALALRSHAIRDSFSRK